jgi:hypothetical protein
MGQFTTEEYVDIRGFIQANAGTMTDMLLKGGLEQRLGKTISISVIRKIRKELGIFKAPGRGKCQIITRCHGEEGEVVGSTYPEVKSDTEIEGVSVGGSTNE